MTKFTLLDINLKPVITEKSLKDASLGRYTFEVPFWSEKEAIKKRVKEVFSVDPVNIRTILYKGKKIRALRTKLMVAGKKWKKALIQVKTGQKIALFETKEDKKK